MIRVAVYLSGNLAAQTLSLVVEDLSRAPGVSLILLSDGEIFEPSISEALRPIHITTPGFELPQVDLLIVAPRTPGKREASLAKAYRHQGSRVLAICTDIGGSADKYRHFEVLPDAIALPDPFAMEAFLAAGIPAARLRRVGSPYMDKWLDEAFHEPQQLTRDLCVMEVPNAWDWRCRGGPTYYTEADIRADFEMACSEARVTHSYRPHPWTVFNGAVAATATDALGPIRHCILRHHAVASTYSTSLLLARMCGVPAVSYQPTPAPIIRRRIFESCGIGLARTYEELLISLVDLPQLDSRGDPVEPFWFEPGNARRNLLTLIGEVAKAPTW